VTYGKPYRTQTYDRAVAALQTLLKEEGPAQVYRACGDAVAYLQFAHSQFTQSGSASSEQERTSNRPDVGKVANSTSGSRRDRKAAVGEVGEPQAYTIRMAAAKLSMSHAHVERLVATGELFSVKTGGNRLIPAWATVVYLRDLCREYDPNGRYANEYPIEDGVEQAKTPSRGRSKRMEY